MPRKPKLKTLKNKLWKICIQIIRQRDKMTCQKCGRQVEGVNAQTSHVYGKGAYPNLKFDLWNLKLMCFYCHKNFWHANPLEAYEWFMEKFPERYEYLQEAKNKQKHYKAHDYQELIEEYKGYIK